MGVIGCHAALGSLSKRLLALCVHSTTAVCRMSMINGYNLGIAFDLAARNYIAEQYVYSAKAMSHRVRHLPVTICSASDCT